MLSWRKHKLESRLLGGISITSDMQMTPPLWQKSEEELKSDKRDKKSFLSDQCKEIEENNRMGKTRDLFKKIRDTKRTFHTRMGTIKDRNGMDLREAEDIKKRWQEYIVLMKVKEESEKVGLKLNIQKTKIMVSGPMTSWQIDGETVETVADFIILVSRITADDDCSHEIKRCLLLGRKAMTNLDSILKSREILSIFHH